MLSTTMMTVLIGVYAVIAIVSLCETNWPRALYWGAVSMLTYALLLMQK